MSGAQISFEDVTVVRGRRRILDVPDLTIEPDQVVGVIGRNGAGKSTLLHVLAGLLKPTTGDVRHGDVSLRRLSAWQRTGLRRRLGFVPQAADYNADLPLTVREVVTMGCAGPAGLFRGIDRDARRRVDDGLDRLDLASLAGRTFRSLSGGEQQKVLLARAMVQQPRLLLLDEPAANLDVDWKQRLVESLDQVAAEHPMTMVMVSHETGLLPACCGRVLLLREGRVFRDGPPDETLTAEVLAELYGCPIAIHTSAGRRHAVATENGRE